MCIAKVGKVLKVRRGRATVELFDGLVVHDVDLSMVGCTKGSYIEVFANLALARLTEEDAEARRKLWLTVRE
jgi:hydrogenase maturation factor